VVRGGGGIQNFYLNLKYHTLPLQLSFKLDNLMHTYASLIVNIFTIFIGD
jgi:hypothetical protein